MHLHGGKSLVNSTKLEQKIDKMSFVKLLAWGQNFEKKTALFVSQNWFPS